MPDRDASKPRDPAAKKARDLGRQRKIAANGSDKAARRHARTIKSMANRSIRRADKQTLDPDFEDTADQINLEHQRKAQHWGTENAAERREKHAETQAHYQEVGGRIEAQRQQWEALRDKIDNEQLVKTINQTLDRLAAQKAAKDKG